MSGTRVTLVGGPRDGAVVTLDGPALRIAMPRCFDSSSVTYDIYAATGPGEGAGFRHAGEETRQA